MRFFKKKLPAPCPLMPDASEYSIKNHIQYNTASLAFIGDAVYSLLAREKLLLAGDTSAEKLHIAAVDMVNASAQAEAAKKIMDSLSESELAVFRRGRNMHTARGDADYHAATGLEALFGWLYLSEEYDRMYILFDIITKGI